MKNYLLTWLKSRNNTKADIEDNPIDILQVEYQDYLNTKRDIKKQLKKNIQSI